jgi:hypothetical protein
MPKITTTTIAAGMAITTSNELRRLVHRTNYGFHL